MRFPFVVLAVHCDFAMHSRYSAKRLTLGSVPRLAPTGEDAAMATQNLIAILKWELATQCEFISIGHENVNTALQVRRQKGKRTWFALQGILSASANASKLLWADRSADALISRKPLRDLAKVTDDSPLNSREVRNALEHFDERVLEWAASNEHIFISRGIGPPEAMISISGTRASPRETFGLFDPVTRVLRFWEDSVDIGDLVNEAERILGVIAPGSPWVAKEP